MKNCDCGYTTEDVGKYLLNRMTLDEESKFQEHILLCDICRKKLDDIHSLCKAFKEEENEHTTQGRLEVFFNQKKR